MIEPSTHQRQEEKEQVEEEEEEDNWLNETPSTEPFNVDPDLQIILKKNEEITKKTAAKYKIYPNSLNSLADSDSDSECKETSLIHIISRRELDKLGRHADSERLYFQEFNRLVKLKYRSSCLYLNQRLNFDPTRVVFDPITKLPITHFSCHISQTHQPNSHPPSASFETDLGMVDGLDYRVIRNEWPYAIPKEYHHMIVWSRLPLLDEKLAKTSEELERARTLGLSGIENKTNEMNEQLDKFQLNIINQNNNNNIHDQDEEKNETEPHSLDYHMAQFVRIRWPFKLGFRDIFWFLNPVYLQSCPELPHFHVFVKKNL